MTEFVALPPARSLHGVLEVPPSKSATNRALLAAALAPSAVEIVRPLESEDTAALRACLRAMGAAIEPVSDGLRVAGPLRGDRAREITLDAGASGTAARFLLAAAAATPGQFLLTGTAGLRVRPMGELVDALRSGGARIAYAGREGRLPVRIEGGLRSSELTVDASRSSQFLSALLLAGIAVDGGLSIRASGAIASRPYVDSTIETLRELGHAVEEGEWIAVRRGDRPAARLEIPGDYSSAVPMLSAVGAAGGEIRLRRLRWPSRDADALSLPVLEAMGIRIAPSASEIQARAEREALRPFSVRATDFPDAVPALAALAAMAPGHSRFEGIRHLRWKESDRIAGLLSLLTAAGADADATEDELTVTGPARPSGTVLLPTFGDHRMAMAAALLSLRFPGLLIEEPDCVAKSYPGFFRDLETLVRRD